MNQGPAPRKWLVEGHPLPVPADGDEMFERLAEAWNMLHRLGGSLIVVAQREQLHDDFYVTTGLVIQWKPFAPAARREPPADNGAQADEVTVEQG